MRYKSPIANMKQVPRVSAIASFVVDEQNQQNHIAHEALFQRTGNSESVFCPGFQKGRVPSEKGTFSAVSGPSKGHN